MITLKGTIRIPFPDQLGAAPLLEAHIRETRDEPGCLHFDVTRDEGDPEVYHVHEVFSNRASFDRHQETVKNRPWGKFSAEFERHYSLEEMLSEE